MKAILAITPLFSLLTAIFVCSCSASPTVSQLMGDGRTNPGGYNDDLADQLRVDNVGGAECASHPLYVFIGSSERVARVGEWHLESPTREEMNDTSAKNAEDFGREVERAAAELATQLAKTPQCKRTSPVKDLVLLRIMDGDGREDSKIITTVFEQRSRAWIEVKKTYWQWDGALTAGSTAFELNMAKDVPAIVWAVATQGAAKLKIAEGSLQRGATVAHDQITYVIKAHGGRLAVGGDLQPDGAVLRSAADLSSAKLSAALLFDTHGAEGSLTSSLFAPRWTGPQVPTANVSDGDEGPQTANVDEGSQTSDIDEGPQTANIDEGKQTSGKGLAFSSLITPYRAASIELPAEGLMNLGQAATYDDLSDAVEGSHRLVLPLGKGKPNLLILDSCYGTVDARRAFEGNEKLAILYNPNPIYYEFLEYKATDATGLLALPGFLYDLASTSERTEGQTALLERMRTGAAETDRDDDTSNGVSSRTLSEARYKELHIWSNGDAQ